jgi:hypothetical protein
VVGHLVSELSVARPLKAAFSGTSVAIWFARPSERRRIAKRLQQPHQIGPTRTAISKRSAEGRSAVG